MQDNYTDDYFDKRKAVSFIMNLKEMYRIREVYMLIFVMLYIVVHSYYLCLFYYSLANLPVLYRSRLPAIRLLAVIKRIIMNKHNLNVV